MTKKVRFDEVVTVLYYGSDKNEKREDRMADIIQMLQDMFDCVNELSDEKA